MKRNRAKEIVEVYDYKYDGQIWTVEIWFGDSGVSSYTHSDEDYSAWLCGPGMGVKVYMFGMPKVQKYNGKEFTVSREDFIKMVRDDLEWYVRNYIRDYMSGEEE